MRLAAGHASSEDGDEEGSRQQGGRRARITRRWWDGGKEWNAVEGGKGLVETERAEQDKTSCHGGKGARDGKLKRRDRDVL
eukprot:749773-Hanusia_phi.AAC.9